MNILLQPPLFIIVSYVLVSSLDGTGAIRGIFRIILYAIVAILALIYIIITLLGLH
jgi:hypothetical protein